MAYKWRILRSAVEQEILFPSEKAYEEYLAKYFESKGLPYEIVDEKQNEDGSYIVVMRKPYNNNEFLRKEPEWSDEDFKLFIQKAFMAEAEAIEQEVLSKPELADVKMPEGSFEKLMEKIREMEQSKQ